MLPFLIAFTGFAVLFHFQASLWESLFHEFVLDISPSRRAWMHSIRRWWPSLWTVHVDHNVLHHYRTYRASYVEMFSRAGEEARLQDALRRQFTPGAVRTFTKSRYGSTFTWYGVVPFAVPVWLGFVWLPVLNSWPEALGCVLANLLFSTPYFAFSMWLHPYLHMRFDRATRESPLWLRLILASPYGVAVRISHYVHHQDPRVNYNLQYGADRLRGRWRAPTAAEWDSMIPMGLIEARHRLRLEGRGFIGHRF